MFQITKHIRLHDWAQLICDIAKMEEKQVLIPKDRDCIALMGEVREGNFCTFELISATEPMNPHVIESWDSLEIGSLAGRVRKNAKELGVKRVPVFRLTDDWLYGRWKYKETIVI